MSENPVAIDLFCGAGGLSEGLSDAGFDIQWAIDQNEAATKTFSENHNIDAVTGDISQVPPKETGFSPEELDLVAGGPPCPTFSRVGRSKINSLENQNADEDERHELYTYFLNYVEYLKPKAFVMENVETMKSAENAAGRSVVDVISNQMEDLGYTVDYEIIDCADFGVPQRRKRIFFIGNRLGKPNPKLEAWETHRKPFENEETLKLLDEHRDVRLGQSNLTTFADKELNPRDVIQEQQSKSTRGMPKFRKNRTHKRPWETVADAILDLPPVSPEGEKPPKEATEYTIGPVSVYQEWVRDVPSGKGWDDMELRNHECRGHNMLDLTLYKLLGHGVGWNIDEVGQHLHPYRDDIFSDKYKKQNPAEPASTLVAHIQKDGHMFIHPTEARSLTVREAARLQSFKDTYRFPVSRTKAYALVGNAVPPLAGKAIGVALQEMLNL